MEQAILRRADKTLGKIISWSESYHGVRTPDRATKRLWPIQSTRRKHRSI